MILTISNYMFKQSNENFSHAYNQTRRHTQDFLGFDSEKWMKNQWNFLRSLNLLRGGLDRTHTNLMYTICRKRGFYVNDQQTMENVSMTKCCIKVLRERSHALAKRGLTLYHTILTLRKKPFENIVGKGENAGYQHVTSIFSFSNHVFYHIKDRNHHLCFVYFVVCKCFQFGHIQNFVVW